MSETITGYHDPEGWPEGGQGAATLEYHAVRDLWAMSQDGDEWGTLLMSYFAAAEVLYLRTGEMVDTFIPGAGLAGMRAGLLNGEEPELDWPATEMWEAIDSEADDAVRTAWINALRDWCAWCSVEADVLHGAGKDY